MTTGPTTGPYNALVAYGFTPNQISSIHALWGTDLVEPFLNFSAHTLRERGHGPDDTYDAIRHELDPNNASDWLDYHFTPHHAHLVEHTPKAAAILHTGVENGFDKFLGHNAPPAFLVNVLLVAQSRDEAEEFVLRYWTARRADLTFPPTPDTYEVVQEVAMLAGLLPVPPCDCGQSHV